MVIVWGHQCKMIQSSDGVVYNNQLEWHNRLACERLGLIIRKRDVKTFIYLFVENKICGRDATATHYTVFLLLFFFCLCSSLAAAFLMRLLYEVIFIFILGVCFLFRSFCGSFLFLKLLRRGMYDRR